MHISRNLIFSASLASFLAYASAGFAATNVVSSTVEPSYEFINNNKSFFYFNLLYVKLTSDNLKYATFVSGAQPYDQSWHYQAIDPSYHPAFDIGFNYAFSCSPYSAAIYWTHLYSNDSDSKQANTSTALATLQFVGPPFEMSPPVFGIKKVEAQVNFEFDNILLNAARLIDYADHQVALRLFGGLSILNVNQTLTTTFSDYAGADPTPYSYPLPPDPSFSFQLQNTSRYLGVGPDLGVSLEFRTSSGFGVMGQFLGQLTVGTIQTKDNFISKAHRLTLVGIGTSHQEITAPNATQVVFGADGKLGVFYSYLGKWIPEFTIEAGYRMATYLNAISSVNPNTLVQPGTVITTPEFSTGTMAIVSTDARSRPFSFNGPFLDVKIAIA